MKYCESYAALLDLFVDGELPADELERVQAHLETCPGCRAYVDDALAIRAGFPDAEDTAVPEGFTENVMERVRKDARKRGGSWRSVRRWTGTAAALAACCALVILLRTGDGGVDSSATAAAGDAEAPAGTDWTEGTETAPEARQYRGAPEEESERFQEDSEQFQTRLTAKSGADTVDKNAVEYGGSTQSALPAPSDPESAPEAAEDAAAGERAALYLTAGEAGSLLDGFAPVREDGLERQYELTAGEYRVLLEALGRLDEWPETAETAFLVVVTGPFES